VKVTATELANDSKAILDRVIQHSEPVQVKRHGKTVAEIVPGAGVSRKELLRVLGKVKWTKAEAAELRKATDVTDVFGYVGRD
jgi:antitoxin (DNA-binding transcriptional repressor) of toxin-antitoxin stability system